MKKCFLSAFFIFANIPVSKAVITISRNVNTGDGILTIDEDIRLTAISTLIGGNTDGASDFSLVLDEWVISDGSLQNGLMSSALSFTRIFIGGSANGSASRSDILDNVSNNFPSYAATENDGLISFLSSSGFDSGDMIVIPAQSRIFRPELGFNPLAFTTFTGNVFLMNENGQRLSNTVAIPESASLLMLGLSGFMLMQRKRENSTSFV
jgi:hypothetical protein